MHPASTPTSRPAPPPGGTGAPTRGEYSNTQPVDSNTQPPDLAALADHLEHFQRRVLQDALNEATGTYWLHRAATFEWAAEPATGDRRRRLLATAEACRAAATLAQLPELETPAQRRETILWQQRLDTGCSS